MIRVVLDTDIVVSALLTPSGPSGLILELTDQQLFQVWTSLEVFAEYQDILNRPKIGSTITRKKLLLAELKNLSKFVVPTKTVARSPDPKDNIFLECAEAAKAHYLVTGNSRHFPERWKYTKRVTPRQFLELLEGLPRKVRR